MQTNARFNVVQLHDDANEWAIIDGVNLPEARIVIAGLNRDEANSMANYWQALINGASYQHETDAQLSARIELQSYLNDAAPYKLEMHQRVISATNLHGVVSYNGKVIARRHGLREEEPQYLIVFGDDINTYTESNIIA